MSTIKTPDTAPKTSNSHLPVTMVHVRPEQHQITAFGSRVLMLMTIVCSMGCGATKDTTGPLAAVVVEKATAQRWVAGTANGGTGTEFAFTVSVIMNEVRFEHVNIAERSESPLLIRPGQPVSSEPVVPVAGDELLLRISIRDDDQAASATRAIIIYSIGGVTHRLMVDPIEHLSPLIRP